MPLAPTQLVPWGGQSIDNSVDAVFTWHQDGTQAAYYIEYVRNISGAAVLDTGWQPYSTAQHTFPSGTFTSTYEYKWRIKIRNAGGQESVFSEWAVFRAGAAATLTITYPASDFDLVTSLPTYQHSYTHPGGYAQTAYQYIVNTGTTWNDFDGLTAVEQESYTWDQLECLTSGETIWDSGRVESTATSVEQPPGYFQVLQYWYKVQVTVWDSGGNEITSDIRTFGIMLSSIPKVPIISLAADPENGRIVASIVNPLPDVGQVEAAYNRLYRQQEDESWLLIQDNVPADGDGYDATCASSKTETYAASAVGTNGVEGGRSVPQSAVCSLDAYWFTNMATGETVKLRADPKWGRMQSEREREEYVPIDGPYPMVLYGARRYCRGSFQAAVLEPEDGTTWPAYVAQIRAVLDAGDAVVFRSMGGDTFKMDIYDFAVEADARWDAYRHVSFSMVEVEEVEAVASYTYDMPPIPTTEGYWVIDPDTGRGMELHIGASWGALQSERDRFEPVGIGQLMPSPGYGNKKAYRSGFSGYLVKPDDGSATLPELLRKFRELVDGKTKKYLMFRSPSRDRFLVDIYGFAFELFDRFDNARQVTFEFIQVGDTS